MKVVGIKAHTENDKGQVLLDLYIRWVVSLLLFSLFYQYGFFCQWGPASSSCYSYVGNVEIDVEVKRYFCKAGVKGIQVCVCLLLRIITSVEAKIAPRDATVCCDTIPGLFTCHCAAWSPAPWHDAGDPGAADRRRAHCWSCHHVFHQAARTSARAHFDLSCWFLFLWLPLPSRSVSEAFPAIDFSAINTFLLRMVHPFYLNPSQKLDINWTGLTNLLDIPGLK